MPQSPGALANDPLIMLADEPTGNLDSNTAEDVFTLFEELVRNGKTLLIVTHDQDIAARCSRRVQLADGRDRIVGGRNADNKNP